MLIYKTSNRNSHKSGAFMSYGPWSMTNADKSTIISTSKMIQVMDCSSYSTCEMNIILKYMQDMHTLKLMPAVV